MSEFDRVCHRLQAMPAGNWIRNNLLCGAANSLYSTAIQVDSVTISTASISEFGLLWQSPFQFGYAADFEAMFLQPRVCFLPTTERAGRSTRDHLHDLLDGIMSPLMLERVLVS